MDVTRSEELRSFSLLCGQSWWLVADKTILDDLIAPMISQPSNMNSTKRNSILKILTQVVLLLAVPAFVLSSAKPESPHFKNAAFIPRRTATSQTGLGVTEPSHSMRMHEPPRIIIIGGPASGKGTQCEILSSHYGAVHLSTGDLLRQAVKEQTEIGKIAEAFMERGDLVPDDVMIKIIYERLEQNDCVERGWILDGFPRTQTQAESLLEHGITADICLVLEVSDEIMTERVTGRRIDPISGKVYHMKFRPPPATIIHRLEQRSDDNLETIVPRIRQFRANFAAIRSHLPTSIVEIDASGSPNDISAQVLHEIETKLRKKQIKL